MEVFIKHAWEYMINLIVISNSNILCAIDNKPKGDIINVSSAHNADNIMQSCH